jgi:NADPH-dependent 2,4-dienoyl-CoA reductase/sulfur reductase-like enzyme
VPPVADHDGQPGRVVVVGAGLAGVTFCDRLRAGGYGGRLVLISAEEHLPYDRPPLSKELLQGKTTAAEVLLRPEQWYAGSGIELRLGSSVKRVDTASGAVLLDGGLVEPADVVVLATGGVPRALTVPGAGHPAVQTLRTLADAEQLRDRLAGGCRLGVIGAGLIGAEVTASAVAHGCEVTLIDPGERPIERVVGARVAAALQAQHRDNGVRLVRGTVTTVTPCPGGGVRLELRGATGDPAGAVECDVAVVGTGIEPELSLAAKAGLAVSGGVLVDFAQRTSCPWVFAVGDIARRVGPAGPQRRLEHWDSAQQQGGAAAAGVLGLPLPAERAPWFWSERYGTNLEVVGRFTDAEAVAWRGQPGAGPFSAVGVRAGRCIGAVAVDRPADIGAARRLIDRDRPVEIDVLADESVPLRALLRG